MTRWYVRDWFEYEAVKTTMPIPRTYTTDWKRPLNAN